MSADATVFNRIGLELMAHLHCQAPLAAVTPTEQIAPAPAAGALPASTPSGRVILVTSARPGEGKSFCAQALATALAAQQTGDVVWVDAAFDTAPPEDDASRRGASGLSEIMTMGSLQGLAPARSGPQQLWRLGRGVLAQSALLYRPLDVRRALFALRAGFALSVLDAPTLDGCGALLAEVDAVVVVVDARHTPRHVVQAAISRAHLAPGRLAGVVLNHRPRPLPRWLGGEA